MRKAFTLIELLVVIGIMGLLGTVSVGGYRAMQRGMEERGVMQNVEKIVKAAFERAQIDRQPTAIYFWNETLRAATLDENEIVVGRAVAIRPCGRLSQVTSGLLIDEFADLNLTYATDETEKEDDGASKGDGAGDAGENTMYLYCLDKIVNNDIKRSIVYSRVSSVSPTEVYLNGRPQDSVGNGKIDQWGFKLAEKNNFTDWHAGSVYGLEFAEITLPHGYIFGSSYSTSIEDPVKEVGTMYCPVGYTDGNEVQNADTKGTVTVYSLRPDGAGGLTAEKVATVEKPQ